MRGNPEIQIQLRNKEHQVRQRNAGRNKKQNQNVLPIHGGCAGRQKEQQNQDHENHTHRQQKTI